MTKRCDHLVGLVERGEYSEHYDPIHLSEYIPDKWADHEQLDTQFTYCPLCGVVLDWSDIEAKRQAANDAISARSARHEQERKAIEAAEHRQAVERVDAALASAVSLTDEQRAALQVWRQHQTG